MVPNQSAPSNAVVRIGHWTAPGGQTGCTVIVFDPPAVASGEVRGGAPATREFALLDPRRIVKAIDAVVLTGGSAFGLAAADGAHSWLAESGRGFPTRVRPVPIVVAMALFDLNADTPPPGPAQGRAAAEAATDAPWSTGRVGAGAGATVGKWRGIEHAVPGGLGHAVVRSGDVEVHALIAVNAVGDIDDGSTVADVVAGSFVDPSPQPDSFENTTIGVIWTNAALDKLECRLVAESGHDGLARALMPAHAQGDGDALVAASVGSVQASLLSVRMLATIAVEQAIRSIRST